MGMEGDGGKESAEIPLMGVVCGRREVAEGGGGQQLARKEPTKGPSDWKRERINTELLTAVQNDDTPEVRRLLGEEKASPNATCRKTRVTTAHIACSRGHSQVLKVLIEHDCRLDKRDNEGFLAVHYAAWEGHISVLETLYPVKKHRPHLWSRVDRGLRDIDSRECLDLWSHDHSSTLCPGAENVPDGSNVLHLACRRLQWGVIPFLMEIATPEMVNAKDIAGMTPLEVVGISVDLPTFRDLKVELQRITTTSDAPPTQRPDQTCATRLTSFLVGKGARISGESTVVPTMRENTSLDSAVRAQNVEVIRMILQEDKDYVKRLNKEQETAVHTAIRCQSYRALEVMMEMAPGATEVRNANQQTPLLVAVKLNLKCGVSSLLEYGADVSAKDCQGNNAIHIAAERGYQEILEEILLSENAVAPTVLNAVNKCQHTPMSLAVLHKHLECLKLLEGKGANVFVTVHDRDNLLHLATRRDSPEILEYLLNSPLKREVNNMDNSTMEAPLHIAAKGGYDKCVIKLIEAGADMTIFSSSTKSNVLHLASLKGHASTIKCIVDNCKKPDVRQSLLGTKDNTGHFPLHLAAFAGHRDCVKELIKGGANLADKCGAPEEEKTAVALILTYVHRSAELLEEVFDSGIRTDPVDCTDATEVNAVTLDYGVLVPATGSEESKKVLSVLEAIIIDCDDDALKENILLHPLTTSFMYLIWKKLRIFFLFLLIIQTLMTLSLSSFVFFVFDSEVGQYDTIFASVSTTMLIVCLVVTINVEVLRTFQKNIWRKFDAEVCIKWVLCALTILMLIFGRRDLAAIAVFTAWIELLLLFSHLVPWGIYVQMFTTVAKSVSKVILLFSFVYAGFTFFFFTLFNGSGPFSTIWSALMKTYIMSNELEYESTFENFTSTTAYEPVGHVFFGLFMFYISIALMNLCIGLAVNDIGRLTARGKMERLIKRVDLLTLLDVAFCPPACQWLLHFVKGSASDVRKNVEVRTTLPSSGQPHALPLGERSRVLARFYSKKKRPFPTGGGGGLVN